MNLRTGKVLKLYGSHFGEVVFQKRTLLKLI